MVQMIVNLNEYEDRILNIVKGKFGVKNKAEAVSLVIDKFGEELLEPGLRPKYIKKLKKIDKEKGIRFKDIDDLRRQIEG